MAACGVHDPAGWLVLAGEPGKIVTDWRQGVSQRPGENHHGAGWIIEAPAVAHELIDLLDGDECARRTWSDYDTRITQAVLAALPFPEVPAYDTAHRLAAHYAVDGDLNWTGLIAAIIRAYDNPGDRLPDDWAPQAALQITAALNAAGFLVLGAPMAGLAAADAGPGDPGQVTAIPDPPVVHHMVVSSGPGKAAYRVWRADDNYCGTGWGVPQGEHGTLAEAMHAAGHDDYGDWGTRTGMTGLLFLCGAASLDAGQTCADQVPAWTIEAPGVAREFAESCSGVIRASRRWSWADERIVTAVTAVTHDESALCQLPYAHACDAGMRLAARHATGGGERGSVTTVDVFAVLVDAYSTAYSPGRLVVPPDVIEAIATRLVHRLTDVGVNMIGTVEALMKSPAARPGTVAAGVHLTSPGARPRPYRSHLFDGVRTPADWPIWQRLGIAEERLRAWLTRPVWLITVPAGRLPARLCSVLSHLVSRLAIPLGVFWGGVYVTWRLSIRGGTSLWWGSLQGPGWHESSTWRYTAQVAAWVLGWWFAACVAEKLIGFELRSARPAAAGRARHHQVTRGLAAAVPFALASAAAAWPWPGWWAGHLPLRVVVAAFYAIGAVAAAYIIRRARPRPAAANAARPEPEGEAR
jgi:hypothetical protein